MSTLYKATINERLERDGVHVWVDEGRPFTVDGTPMVRMSSVIVPAEGWHASKSAALISAAERIEEMAQKLILQAGRVRVDAAKEVPHA